MSTITTTPAPQINRTPLLVGIAAVGVVAVCAVAIPRIASTVGSSATTGTAASSAVITQHDLVEHRADVATAVENARISSAVERQLTHEGKLRAGRIAATTAGLAGVRVGESTVKQQVGGLAPTFGYVPANPSRMVYDGRGLVELSAAAATVAASTLRQQVGGLAPTFAYTPAGTSTGLSPVYAYNGRELVQVTPAIAPGSHSRADAASVPVTDAERMAVIKRHYAGWFPTPATHEFR